MNTNEAGKETTFKKLAPVVADIEAYRPAFDFVFAQDDLRNIALSGPYSSGKSSVMSAVMQDDEYTRNHEFLTVSLPHFGVTPKRMLGEGGSAEDDTSAAELEALVLNQLVHSVDGKSAPRSPFRKTTQPNTALMLVGALLVMLFVGAVLFLIDFGRVSELVPPDSLAVCRTVSAACVLFVVFVGAFCLLRHQILLRLVRKVKAGSYEVEIVNPEKESKFNAYMDGVIYLLNSSDADVVVFEDLDRHCSVAIFERLRELNVLVNRNRPPKKKPLRFFYLIRDDLFVTAADRAKFFDFIIPVVPYTDHGNSGDRLIADFAKAGVKVDPTLLYDVSLFIDDPRLLNDIVNESQILARKLFGELGSLERQVAEKVIGMTVYKVVFPDDYALLQRDQGYLHDVLGSREHLVEVLTQEERESIDACERELNTTAGQKNLETLIERIASNKQSIRDCERFEFCDLLASVPGSCADDVFNLKLCDSEDPLWRQTMGSDARKVFLARPEYQVLRILVERGAIDHSYRQYIGSFHYGELTERDIGFMRAMADAVDVGADYELDNPQAVIYRTPTYRFGQGAARNYCLVKALLEMDEKEKFEMLLDVVARDGDVSFVVDYVLSDFFAPEFFAKSFKVWYHMVSDVVHCGITNAGSELFELLYGEPIDEERMTKFAWSVLEDGRLFLEMPKNRETIRDYISRAPGFLRVGVAQRSRSPEALQALAGCEVRFSALDATGIDREPLEYVCDNSLYTPTPSMFAFMLGERYGDRLGDGCGQLLDCLVSREGTPLYEYASENADGFVGSYLAEMTCDPNTIEAALWVLNNDNVNVKTKEAFADHLVPGFLPALESVTDQRVWTELVSAEVPACTADNVLRYFGQIGQCVDRPLADWINDCGVSGLAKKALGSEAEVAIFTHAVAVCPQLSEEAVKEIVQETAAVDDAFSGSDVSSERVRTLFTCGYITMTQENLAFIRGHFPDELTGFIERNEADYCALVQQIPSRQLTDAEVDAFVRSVRVESIAKADFIAQLVPHVQRTRLIELLQMAKLDGYAAVVLGEKESATVQDDQRSDSLLQALSSGQLVSRYEDGVLYAVPESGQRGKAPVVGN